MALPQGSAAERAMPGRSQGLPGIVVSEQIILLRNRFAIALEDVNPLYLVDVERIHTITRNR